MNFKELGLSSELVDTISELGYEVPTEVQEKTIPLILQDNDVIVKSKTGTGKTAAYALPIIESLDLTLKGVQAVVLCPTRELAMQVEQEFIKYLKYVDGVKTACIYGGQNIEKQTNALNSRTKIVVGTTGRIIDHINRKNLWLNKVKNVVLDEADEMVNMGFKEDIETILKIVNVDANVHMFSATIDEKLKEVARNYMINPEEVILEGDSLTVDNVDELAVSLKVKMKNEASSRFLNRFSPDRAIVFCSTKKNVDGLTTFLKSKGHFVEALHSDIMQNDRKEIVNDFREGKVNVLVATDVAARGLDIKELDLVINYDLPFSSEYYVHRIGRAGRNGKVGVAISYVVGDEKHKLDSILAYTKSKVEYVNIPRAEDIDLETKEGLKEVTGTLKPIEVKSKGKNKKNKNEDKSKVKLSVGKRDNVKAKDILGSLAAHTAMPKDLVGHIEVTDEYSTVVVPNFYVKEVITSMTGNEVKGVYIKSVEEI